MEKFIRYCSLWFVVPAVIFILAFVNIARSDDACNTPFSVVESVAKDGKLGLRQLSNGEVERLVTAFGKPNFEYDQVWIMFNDKVGMIIVTLEGCVVHNTPAIPLESLRPHLDRVAENG